MSKKKKGFFEKVGDFLSGLFGKKGKKKKTTSKRKSPSKKTTGKKKRTPSKKTTTKKKNGFSMWMKKVFENKTDKGQENQQKEISKNSGDELAVVQLANSSKKKERKKKTNKEKPQKNHYQRHFRKFHSKETTGHPSYIYDEDKKNFKCVGLTSAPVTNGVSNIPLDKNPEPGNNDKSYLRPAPMEINKGVKNEKLKGWSFAPTDKKKVQDVIEGKKE